MKCIIKLNNILTKERLYFMKKQIKIVTIVALIIVLISSFNVVNAQSTSMEIVQKEQLATKDTATDSQEYKDKSNNDLSALSVSGYELSPEFNKNTTSYYVTVPTSVTSLDVLATAEKEKATIKITGNTKMTKTDNTITITVTSENKLTKKYLIYVTKQDDNGLKLSSLEVEGCELLPAFTANTYYYEAKIAKSAESKKLNITAKSNSSSATVEVIGNNANFESGKELISIIVKLGDKVTTYQVLVEDTLATIQTVTTTPDGFLGVALTVIEKTEDFFQDTIKRT